MKTIVLTLSTGKKIKLTEEDYEELQQLFKDDKKPVVVRDYPWFTTTITCL